jgi:thiol-disulfide isomerase/thioredoxin
MKMLIAAIAVIAVSMVLLSRLGGTAGPVVNSEIPEASATEKTQLYDRAKELVSPQGYINTGPITIAENIGKKVILVDFWTYSCINCQRTLPYLNAWHEKYSDLLIIGVHTPEFEFEKDISNLQRAVDKFGIEYPVVQDNNYQTWRAYSNNYWPRKYLIDIDGYIVYDHIGEGAYEETEKKIQELLRERALKLNESVQVSGVVSPDVEKPDFEEIGTREIYFGRAFSRGQLGNPEGQALGPLRYYLPAETDSGKFYLEGDWKIEKDYMELLSPGSIALEFTAKKVNIVAGANKPVNLELYLDGKLLGNTVVEADTLYNVADALEYGTHELLIKSEPGLRAYTFTFG